ncbi:MAG: cobalamin biosynthesis protein, partial [Desulfurivibrionaceae bacterium]
HTEAAVAGALGVQLGGPNSYFGTVLEKPTIGDPTRPLEPQDILRANRLMLLSSALTLLVCLALRRHLLALLPTMLP